MDVNTHRFIRWLSDTGVQLDTGHLTAPERLHHKTDTTKSCFVLHHSTVPGLYCTDSDRKCGEDQTGNRPDKQTNKYTGTRKGSTTNALALRQIYKRTSNKSRRTQTGDKTKNWRHRK